MQYGLITFAGSENTGDAIQSIAAMRLLPRVDLLLDRESLHAVDGDETIRAIGNGWYAHHPENWPPSPSIDLLPISMHFSPRAMAGYFREPNATWWRRLGRPVGARDLTTLEALRQAGVDAVFSGCLTLTLARTEACGPRDGIILCDVDDRVRAHVEARAGQRVEVVTHHERADEDIDMKLNRAERLLAAYGSANAVVTSRLHAALPCLAMGTPVFFITEADDAYRFAGLSSMAPSGSAADFMRGDWDVNRPPPNPEAHLPCRNLLLEQVQAFVEQPNERLDRGRRPTADLRSPLQSVDGFGARKNEPATRPAATPPVGFEDRLTPHNILIAEIARLRGELEASRRTSEELRADKRDLESQLLRLGGESVRHEVRSDHFQDLLRQANERLARAAEANAGGLAGHAPAGDEDRGDT